LKDGSLQEARTYMVKRLGQPDEISPEEIARAHRYYLEEYG
jgi:hypothetical protein